MKINNAEARAWMFVGIIVLIVLIIGIVIGGGGMYVYLDPRIHECISQAAFTSGQADNARRTSDRLGDRLMSQIERMEANRPPLIANMTDKLMPDDDGIYNFRLGGDDERAIY